MSVGAQEFRHALTHWATGVAVLTCVWEEQPSALTVTSFSSVSLDPPLVAVCIGQQSRFHAPVTAAGAWTVSVLAAEQGDLARRFAAHGRAYATQFDQVATAPAPSGAPVLDGSLVWLDCRTVARHEAGDHTIVVGEVLHTGPLSQTGRPVAESPRRDPLTYYRGTFSDAPAH